MMSSLQMRLARNWRERLQRHQEVRKEKRYFMAGKNSAKILFGLSWKKRNRHDQVSRAGAVRRRTRYDLPEKRRSWLWCNANIPVNNKRDSTT